MDVNAGGKENDDDDDDIDKSKIMLLLTPMQLFYFILKLTRQHQPTNQPTAPSPPQQLAFKHISQQLTMKHMC
ncbi:unnamed protein product [Litomosoides sigmodontis]|uniref:Uncharacterized protein n=1 Tax=Litomosoides sigmodontis TaxID=42156 RepID=A0A3P6TA38_LITSI|nr:unnamed protein product [Litomosoides sigmodontis]